MPPYQQIVDEIRSFLLSSDHTLTDDIRELAVNYARACRETNERFGRCGEFLQKGLNSEAIQFAQTEPSLLDVIATLDFPERPQWESIALAYALPHPPALSIAVAEALNEAYSAAQPLEHLLRQHRRLALVRAPLTARLDIMRQIKRIDSDSPVWEEDIVTFEKARIAQLDTEVKAALTDERPEALRRLLDEVRHTRWSASPPLDLIRLVEQSAHEKELKSLRQRLEVLAGDLHNAVAAFDVPKVRELRELWNHEAVQGKLDLTDPLWERVAPAFDWLAEQERREAQGRKQKIALAELQSALELQTPRERLEHLYRSVVRRDGEAMPESLEQLYRTRMTALNAAVRRRNRLLAVAAGAVVLILGGVVWLGVNHSIATRRTGEALHTVKQKRDAGMLFEAEAYLADLAVSDPATANAPAVLETTKRIVAEATAERERIQSFQAALQEAAKGGASEAGAAALAQAQALARLPEEKTAVQRLRGKQAEKARRTQQDHDRDFQRRVTELESRIRNLEQLAARLPEDPQTLQACREILAAVEALERIDGISEEARRSTSSLRERIDHVQRLLASETQAARLADRMTRILLTNEDEKAYGNLLQEYALKFADTPRGKTFAAALPERTLWEPVIGWGRLIRPWRANWFDLQPAEARERAEKVRPFMESHPGFVDMEVAREYLQALEAIVQQDENSSATAAAQLRAVFGHFLNKDLWYVMTQDRTYYLRQDPSRKIEDAEKDPAKALVRIKYLDGLEGKEAVTSVRQDSIQKYGRAPQSVIADMVARIPPNFADRTWDRAMMRIAREIQASAEMDPVIQLTLLRKVIELAGKGSCPLSQALAPHRRSITGAKLELSKIPWMSPGNSEAAASRPSAKRVLDALPSFKGVLEASNKKKENLLSALAGSDHEIVGWLARSGQGYWHCRGAAESLRGEFSLAVVVAQGSQKCLLKPVGAYARGKAQIDPGNDANFLEGRVVFASRNTP